MDFSGRTDLLLEIVRNLTEITYPEYADDNNIKEKIFKYIYHLKKFKENPSNMTSSEMRLLSKLHRFFYGNSFNFTNPDDNIPHKSSIYDNFKSTYNKIDTIINETNDINAELLKSLLSLISVYYEPSNNKDNIINEYINNIIIPIINSYKGVNITNDKIILTNDNVTNKIGSDIKKIIKEEKKEDLKKQEEKEKLAKQERKEDLKKQEEKEKLAKQERNDELEKTRKHELEKLKLTNPNTQQQQLLSEQQQMPLISEVIKTETPPTITTTSTINPILSDVSPSDDVDDAKLQKDLTKLAKKPDITKLDIDNEDLTLDIQKKFITVEKDDKKNNQLKEYLQALYLQLNINENEVDFINEIIKLINDLKLFDDLNNFTNDKDEYIKYVMNIIKEYINKYEINDLLENYNKSLEINSSTTIIDNTKFIITLLSLFYITDEKECNYIIPDDKEGILSYNLKLISKLFNYPNDIHDKFLQNQLLFLFKELNKKPSLFIDIIENLRLLIELIIIKREKLLDINFKDNYKIDEKNDISIIYNKIINILRLLSINNDYKEIYNDIIKNQNYYFVNILIKLIRDYIENKGDDDIKNIQNIIKLLIINENEKIDNKSFIKKIISDIKTEYNTNIKKDNVFNILNFLEKIILNKFKINFNRIFKDEKKNIINEETIIRKLCNKEYNLDTIINKFPLKDLIKFKKIYDDNFNIKEIFYKKSLITREEVILNDYYFKELKEFDCNFKVFSRDNQEYLLKDIIYISSENYKLHIIYEKNNDYIEYIDILINYFKKYDTKNDTMIKSVLKNIIGIDIDNDNIENFNKFRDYCKNINYNKYDKFFYDNWFEEKKYSKYNMYKSLNYIYKFYIYKHRDDLIRTEIIKKISEFFQPKFYIKTDMKLGTAKPFTFEDFKTKYIPDNSLDLQVKYQIKENINDEFESIINFLDFKNIEINKESKDILYIKKQDFKDHTGKMYNKKDFLQKILNENKDKIDLNEEITIVYLYYFDKKDNYYYKYYNIHLKDLLTFRSLNFPNYFSYNYNEKPKYYLQNAKEPLYNFLFNFFRLKDTGLYDDILEKDFDYKDIEEEEEEEKVDGGFFNKDNKILIEEITKYYNELIKDDTKKIPKILTNYEIINNDGFVKEKIQFDEEIKKAIASAEKAKASADKAKASVQKAKNELTKTEKYQYIDHELNTNTTTGKTAIVANNINTIFTKIERINVKQANNEVTKAKTELKYAETYLKEATKAKTEAEKEAKKAKEAKEATKAKKAATKAEEAATKA